MFQIKPWLQSKKSSNLTLSDALAHSYLIALSNIATISRRMSNINGEDHLNCCCTKRKQFAHICNNAICFAPRKTIFATTQISKSRKHSDLFLNISESCSQRSSSRTAQIEHWTHSACAAELKLELPKGQTRILNLRLLIVFECCLRRILVLLLDVK